MNSASSCKYSHMSDEEFVRFADGMVGWDLYKEALARLERRLDAEADRVKEAGELERAHRNELDDLGHRYEQTIGILESRIEVLESELEHA